MHSVTASGTLVCFHVYKQLGWTALRSFTPWRVRLREGLENPLEISVLPWLAAKGAPNRMGNNVVGG